MNEVKFDFSRIGTGLKFICNLDQTTHVEEIWNELDETVLMKPKEVREQKFQDIIEESSQETLQLPEVQLVLEETHFEEIVEKEPEIILEVVKEFTEDVLDHMSIEDAIKLIETGKIKLNKTDLIQRYYLSWQDALRHFPDLTMDELKNNTNITAREYIDQFPACDFQEFINVFAIVPTDVNVYAYVAHIAQGGLPAAFVRKTLNDLRGYYNNDPLKTIMNNFNLQIGDLIHHFDVTFDVYTDIMSDATGKYKKKTLDQVIADYRGYRGINSAHDLINVFGINYNDFLTYFDRVTLTEAIDLFGVANQLMLAQWFIARGRARPRERLEFGLRYSITNYLRDIRNPIPPKELLKLDLAVKQLRAVPGALPPVQLTAVDLIGIYNDANKLTQNIRDEIIELCVNGFVFNGVVKFTVPQNVAINFAPYAGNVLLSVYEKFDRVRVINTQPHLNSDEIIKAIFRITTRVGATPTLNHVLQTKVRFNLNLTIRNILEHYPDKSKTELELATAYRNALRAFVNKAEFLDQLVDAEDKLVNLINYTDSHNALNLTSLDLVTHFDHQLYFQDGSVIDAIKLIIRVLGPLNAGRIDGLVRDLTTVDFRTLTAIEFADIVRGSNFVTIDFMINWSRLNHPLGNQFITFTPKDCVSIFDHPVNTYGLSAEVGNYAIILRKFAGITTRDFKEAFDDSPRYIIRNAFHLCNVKRDATAAEVLMLFPATSTRDLQAIFTYPNATALYMVKNTATKEELANIFRRNITAAELKGLFPAVTVAEIKDLIPRTTIAELVAIHCTPLEIALSNRFTVDQIKQALFNNDFRGLHQLYSTTPRLVPITPQQLWNLYRAQNSITLNDLIDLYNDIEYRDLVLIFDPLKQNPQQFFNALNAANRPPLPMLYELYRQDPNPNPVTPQLALQLYPATKPTMMDEIYIVIPFDQMIQLYHNQGIQIDVENLHKAYPMHDLNDFITDGITPREMPLYKMVKLFRNQIRSNVMNRFYGRRITVQDLQSIDNTYTVDDLIRIFNMNPMEYINEFNNRDFNEFAKYYPDVAPNDGVWDLVGDIELDQIKAYYEANGLIHDRITLLRACKKLATAPTVEQFFDLFNTTIPEIYELYFKADKNAFAHMLQPCLEKAVGTFEDNLKSIIQLSKAVPSKVINKLNVIREFEPDFNISDVPQFYNRFPTTVEDLIKFDFKLTPKQCYELLGIELKEFNTTNINKAYKPPKRIMKAPSHHQRNITEEQLKSYIDQILIEDDGVSSTYNLNDLYEEIERTNIDNDFDLDSNNYLDTISNMEPEIDYNELYDFDGDLYGGGGVKVYSNDLKTQVLDKLDNPSDDVDHKELSKYSEMINKILSEEEFFKNNCNSIIYADANKNIKMLLTDQLRTCNLLYILYLNYVGDNSLAFFRNFLKAFYKITFTYIHPSQLTNNLMHALINSIQEEQFKFKIDHLIRKRLVSTEIEKRKEEIRIQVFEEAPEDESLVKINKEIDKRLKESLKDDPIKLPQDLKFEDGSIKQKNKTICNRICKWLGITIPDYYLRLSNDVDDNLADNIYCKAVRDNALLLLDITPNDFFMSLMKKNKLTLSYLVSIFKIIASKTIPNNFNDNDRSVIRTRNCLTIRELKKIYPEDPLNDPPHPLIEPLKAYFKEKYKYTMDSVEDFIAIMNIGFFSRDWLLFRAIDYVLQVISEHPDVKAFNNSLPLIKDLKDVMEKTTEHKKNDESHTLPYAVVYYYCDLYPKIYRYIPEETEKHINSEDIKSFFLYPLDNPLTTYDIWKNMRSGEDTKKAFAKIIINSANKDLSTSFMYGSDNSFDFTSAFRVNQKPDGSVDPVLEFRFKNYVDKIKGRDPIKEQLKTYITLVNKIRIIFYQIIIHHPNVEYRDAQMLVGSLTNYITNLKSKKIEESDKPLAVGIINEIMEYDESFDLTDFEDTWSTLPDNIVDPSTINVNIKKTYVYKIKESYKNSFNSSFTHATPAMRVKLQTRHGIMKSMMFYLLTNEFKDGCSWFIVKNDIAQYIYDNPDIFTVITFKHVLDVFENVPDSLSLWLLSKHIVETQLANKDPFAFVANRQELNLPIPQVKCKQHYLCSVLFLWLIGELKVDIWNNLTVYNCEVPRLKGVNTSLFFNLEGSNALLTDDNVYKDFLITLLFESVNRLGIDNVNELASEFANSSLKMVPMKLNIDGNSSESIKAYSNWANQKIETLFNIGFYYVLLKTLEDNSFATNHLRLVDDFYEAHKLNVKQLTEKRITGNDYNLFYKRFLSNVYKINKSGVGTLSNTLDYYEESFKLLVKNKKDDFIDLLRTKYLDKLGLFIYITDWLIIVETFGKYNDELTKLWLELEKVDGLSLNYEVIKRGFKVKSAKLFDGTGKLLLIDYEKNGSTITRIINQRAVDDDFFNQLSRELGKEVITLNKNFSIYNVERLVNDKIDNIFENDFINEMYDALNLHESAYYDYSVDYVVLTALKIIVNNETTKELIEKVLHLISRTGSVEHIKQIIKYVREVINNPIILIKVDIGVYDTLTTQATKLFKPFNDVFCIFNNSAIYPELDLFFNSRLAPSWESTIKKKSVSFVASLKPGKEFDAMFNPNPNEPHKQVGLRRLIESYYEKAEHESDAHAFKRVYEFYRFGNPISDDKWPKFYIDLYLLEKISDSIGAFDTFKLKVDLNELIEICYNYIMYKVGLHNVMFATTIKSNSTNSDSKDVEMYCYNLNKKLIPWLKLYYPYYPIYKIKPINKNEFKEIMLRKSLKHPVTPNDRFKTIAIRNGRFNEKEVNPKIDGMYAYNDVNFDDKLTGGSKSELPTILKFLIITFLIIILIVIVIKIVKTITVKRPIRNKN